MKMAPWPLLLGLVVLCWNTVSGPLEAEVTLPPGQSLLPDDLSNAFQLTNPSDSTMSFTALGDEGHTGVLTLSSNKTAPHYWEIQVRCPNPRQIHRGDVLLLSFSLRTLSTRNESGDGIVQAVLEQSRQPYPKSVNREIHAGQAWKKLDVPFVAGQDLKPGEGALCFCFGFAEQQVEIADIALSDFAQTVKLQDLPQTTVTYVGREPDAPWRKEADARIEKYRKGPLTIKVIDATTHQPIPDAEVTVNMLKHAFGFGTAVARLDQASPADQKQYQQFLTTYFNKVVPENALKWGAWEADEAGNLAFVNGLAASGLRLKGHNVIWPGWRGWENNPAQGWDVVPRQIYDLRNNPDELRQHINARITDVTTAVSGKLEEWDVINEPYWNNDIMKVLGDSEMAQWFHLVHQCDPRAKLMVNEAVTAEWNVSSDNLVRVVKLIDQGDTPVDGIGLQCHYEESLTPMPEVYRTLDRYSSALNGKFIQITEFDVTTNDEQLQADYLRDFMTMAFSYPAVTDFLMWGFWEGADWKPSAALWRKDWSLKPNGQAYIDLVTKKWWTKASGQTDADGNFFLRGFYGSYEVSIRSGNRVQKIVCELKPGRTEVAIALP